MDLRSALSAGALATRNPHARSIESIVSYDMKITDKTTNGGYRISKEESIDHPDSRLIGAIETAKWESLTAPSQAQLLSRSSTMKNYEQLFNLSIEKKDIRIRQAIVVSQPRFMRSPLQSLSLINLSDMLLDKVHKERYILCRVIHASVRMVAVQAAVEDSNGDVADLALYHCFETKGMKRDDISSLLPMGLIVLVREPWFKLGQTGGHPTIRVDSPTDISFPTHSELLSHDIPAYWRPSESLTANDYKNIGNKAHGKNHLEAAVRAYTSGLSIDPSASLLRLNRALCHLSLGNLSQALADARAASGDEILSVEQRTKARYRTALAYYAMDRFSEALEIVGDEAVHPSFASDYKGLLERTEVRLKEQMTGEYDWFGLHKLYSGKSKKTPDVAEYLGPIKFVEMPGNPTRRGIVSTRAIAVGELLSVSKPFTSASAVEFPEDALRCFVLEDRYVEDKTYFELIGRCARRLANDRSAAASLFLDLGTTKDPLPRPSAGTPTFVTKGAAPWTDSEEYNIGDVDIETIRETIKTHVFTDSIPSEHPTGTFGAMYLVSSLVGHSCNGNVVRSSLGPLQCIRASRDMKAGEEITSSFVGGHEVAASFLGREPMLKRWMSSCDCSLCDADRRDGRERCAVREKYYQDLREVQAGLTSQNALIIGAYMRDRVVRVEETYLSSRTEPMYVLGYAQRLLGVTHQLTDSSRACDAFSAALTSFGIRCKTTPPKRVPASRSQMNRNALIIYTNTFLAPLHDTFACIQLISKLADLKSQLKQDKIARHWAIAALWTHEAFYGPGKEYLWDSMKLNSDNSSHPLVQFLEAF